jgi:hypothetical protein
MHSNQTYLNVEKAQNSSFHWQCKFLIDFFNFANPIGGQRNVSFISTPTSGVATSTISGPSSPPFTSPRESLFGFPSDRTSVETTSTILSTMPTRMSTNSNQGFSLPTAQPRQSRLNNSLPRSSTKNQPTSLPPNLPTGKIDTSKYQHLLLPMPVFRGQQTKRQGNEWNQDNRH